ncbi:MAG: TldD/PmbA family protein [Acidobacteria bacterium]|nr:TldD/PmbA family protein [Acidobacteriota bacterium]
MNFREIADIVMRASPADQTEVVVLEQNESLTRFANSVIHQNVTELNSQVTVRSVIGTRVGIAVSNDTRRESLEHLPQRAFEVARLQPENPEFRGLPEPQPISGRASFDSEVEQCSPEERAMRIAVICRKAATSGCIAAGSLTTSVTTIGVANSLGVFALDQSTLADATTVIMENNASGWAQRTGWQLDALNAEEMADEALRKVKLGIDPVDFAPGEYPVVLDPYATADLLDMLAYDGMGALAFQEERSWLNGRIGTRIMGDSVTIVDDGLDPSGIPMPFDFEGVPKKPVPIIEEGVARGPVYDSFTAGRNGTKQSTGHATQPSPYGRFGPVPFNLFLRPGPTSLDAMIRSTKLGLYITRFWYTRTVHPRDAVVTGMTRDGTFVIRDGEIAHPVKSLRFTQSYVEALKYAEAIGSNALVLRTGWGGATTVPPVKLAKFRFTSSTR